MEPTRRRHRRLRGACVVVFVAIGVASPRAAEPATPATVPSSAPQAGDDLARLGAIIARVAEIEGAGSPTTPGVPPPGSRPRARASRERIEGLRAELHAIDRDALPLAHRIDYDVVDFMLFRRLPTLFDGRPTYAYSAQLHTSLNLTPDQLHEIGLAEVERLRGEMTEVMRETGFAGSLEEFFNDLRQNPDHYPDDADEILFEARRLAARMQEQLPRLFHRLPSTPFVIEPADSTARARVSAFYDGIRPREAGGSATGRIVIEARDLERRPRWGLEALVYHEAIPGHHLQQALQHENDAIPEFRRDFQLTAFIEGWGLYAERLAAELDMYEDAYSEFGRLNSEMWRALRLVVDTELQRDPFSRDTRNRVIEYMRQNSALSFPEIIEEVGRYQRNPGQALAYKIGEIMIRGLRGRAETALGDRFDLRDFHEVMLSNGSVPLTTLEDVIDSFIADATG